MSKGLILYEHNKISYEKIRKSYEDGEKIVGIVHATGTGKSYNALELVYQNKDKKEVYVVPSIAIIEHLKNIISESNLILEEDFSNLEFRTYQSFINLSFEEIANIECDPLIIDEFHRLGAPVWGARINTLINTHENMKIFGMSAYTVRERGTIYERDMADNDELFAEKIVSRYDLSDAFIDGVLPKPIYKSSHINLSSLVSEVEEELSTIDKDSKDYKEYFEIIKSIKRKIHEAQSIPSIIKKNIKPNGKYIYFCPPISIDNKNDIETIKNEAYNWFLEIAKKEDIVFYTSTSEMRELGKLNRDSFYNDTDLEGKNVDGKLRVMFAINQYNEGIHAPNVDGVIMGRSTSSDIVFFEQLGRALSVRGDTKKKFLEYENLSIEELKKLFNDKDILMSEDVSKSELIEKLITPIVIDLTDNYTFIKELENNLGTRIKEVSKNLGSDKKEKLK